MLLVCDQNIDHGIFQLLFERASITCQSQVRTQFPCSWPRTCYPIVSLEDCNSFPCPVHPGSIVLRLAFLSTQEARNVGGRIRSPVWRFVAVKVHQVDWFFPGEEVDGSGQHEHCRAEDGTQKVQCQVCLCGGVPEPLHVDSLVDSHFHNTQDHAIHESKDEEMGDEHVVSKSYIFESHRGGEVCTPWRSQDAFETCMSFGQRCFLRLFDPCTLSFGSQSFVFLIRSHWCTMEDLSGMTADSFQQWHDPTWIFFLRHVFRSSCTFLRSFPTIRSCRIVACVCDGKEEATRKCDTEDDERKERVVDQEQLHPARSSCTHTRGADAPPRKVWRGGGGGRECPPLQSGGKGIQDPLVEKLHTRGTPFPVRKGGHLDLGLAAGPSDALTAVSNGPNTVLGRSKATCDRRTQPCTPSRW